MDMNLLGQLVLGLLGAVMVSCNLVMMTVRTARPPLPEVKRIPIEFSDGSIFMVDPTNQDEVDAVAEIFAEDSATHEEPVSYYSPTRKGMPARDISEYDWSQTDLEIVTAGPIDGRILD